MKKFTIQEINNKSQLLNINTNVCNECVYDILRNVFK